MISGRSRVEIENRWPSKSLGKQASSKQIVIPLRLCADWIHNARESKLCASAATCHLPVAGIKHEIYESPELLSAL